MNITVVILNYNCATETITCINSLLEQTYKNIPIVIVDNCSTDNSISVIESVFPQFLLIKRNVNDGYAAGNNVGITVALQNGADYVLVANPDTTFRTDFIEKLMSSAKKNPNAGIITGLAYRTKNGKIFTTGGMINKLLPIVEPLKEKEVFSEKKVEFIAGCLMLIKKEVFYNVGLFNEKLFMYMEDVEYSLAVSKKYDLLYTPTAVFYHDSGGGNSWKDYLPFYLYYSTRNRFIIFGQESYLSMVRHYTVCIIIGLVKMVQIGSMMFSSQRSEVKSKIIALYDGIKDGIARINYRNRKY